MRKLIACSSLICFLPALSGWGQSSLQKVSISSSSVVCIPVLQPPWYPLPQKGKHKKKRAVVSQVPYDASVSPERQFYDQGSSVALLGRTFDYLEAEMTQGGK